MKFSETSIGCHRSGDIVLTKSKKIGTLIVEGQKHYYKKTGNYSHVAICVNPGVFAEATVGRKIGFFYYKDLSRGFSNSTKWRTIRNLKVASDALLQQKIVKWISYQTGKSYDLKGLISPKKKGRKISDVDTPVAICSEFVGSIFAKINNVLQCKLFDNPPNTLIPADFEALPNSNCADWIKVDKAKLTDNYDHSILHTLAESYIENQNFFQSAATQHSKLIDLMTNLSEVVLAVSKSENPKMLKGVQEALGGNLPPEKFDIDFAYNTFSNFKTYTKFFFEDYTPSNFITQKSKKKVVVQTKLLRRKMIEDFSSFIKSQNNILNTFFEYSKILAKIKESTTNPEIKYNSYTKIFSAIVELLEKLPLNNIDNYILRIGNVVDNENIQDEEVITLQKEFLALMNKIKIIKNDNTLEILKNSLAKNCTGDEKFN